jgi:hypothetical protein
MHTTEINTVALDQLVDTPVAPAQPELRERRRPVFTGNEDHDITLADASVLVRSHREKAGKNAVKGGFFGSAALQQVLDQEGVVGIHYYFGEERDGRPVLVIVGADQYGNDLTDGFLLERGVPCPPFCGWFNQLNS